jgi:hypothetical protein
VRHVALIALLLAAPVARAAPPAAAPAPEVDGAQAVLRARAGLAEVIAFLRSRPALLDPRRRDLLTRDEKLALWGAWASALDHATVLDALRGGLVAWSRADGDRAARDLARAAFLASYARGLELVALVDPSRAASVVLDEAGPELGLPAGTWRRYRLHQLNAGRATEFAALEAAARGDPAPAGPLGAAIAADRAVIWAMGKGKGHALTVRNAGRVLVQASRAAFFPVQKGVSTWMGDTRVRRGDTALVSPEQIAALAVRLQPGDVLLERREWYLSNLGLPGFWTHAALYVGTPDERRAFFDDGGVRTLARAKGREDGDLEALLSERYPEAARASRTPDATGHPPRVLEAISEGVSFTSLEHSAAADSLAVLRPRLDRRARAVAVLRAFLYAGRPYDFDFDFLTDAALVCSELVYKVYELGAGMPGVRFPLEEIAGRRLVTPNGMARQFDAERACGAPTLDLVLFLDGKERRGGASEEGEDAFRSSWKRPKWHAIVAR